MANKRVKVVTGHGLQRQERWKEEEMKGLVGVVYRIAAVFLAGIGALFISLAMR